MDCFQLRTSSRRRAAKSGSRLPPIGQTRWVAWGWPKPRGVRDRGRRGDPEILCFVAQCPTRDLRFRPLPQIPCSSCPSAVRPVYFFPRKEAVCGASGIACTAAVPPPQRNCALLHQRAGADGRRRHGQPPWSLVSHFSPLDADVGSGGQKNGAKLVLVDIPDKVDHARAGERRAVIDVHRRGTGAVASRVFEPYLTTQEPRVDCATPMNTTLANLSASRAACAVAFLRSANAERLARVCPHRSHLRAGDDLSV